jgi:thiamine biosynthesis lipoprotein
MTERRTTFQAIGTQWDVQVQESLSDEVWQDMQARLRARIEVFDATYSRFRDDSFVTQLSRVGGTYDLPDDGLALLQCYDRLYQATDGRLTPLIGQTMVQAGYDANYSLQKGRLQPPPRWEDVLSYDAHRITLRRPALLDFGAAGKGYLVDIVSELLAADGMKTYFINAGGDILHRSADMAALQVGLENPFDTSEAIGVVALGNQSLCASAGSKRQWADLHHTIDPVSLASPEGVVATWAIAGSTMLADGLATALFFTDPEVLRSRFAFSYAVLDAQGGIHYSKDFSVTLFEEA